MPLNLGKVLSGVHFKRLQRPLLAKKACFCFGKQGQPLQLLKRGFANLVLPNVALVTGQTTAQLYNQVVLNLGFTPFIQTL